MAGYMQLYNQNKKGKKVMKYTDIIKSLDYTILYYKQGKYTLEDCLYILEKEIYRHTMWEYDIDKRIKRKNKLWKHCFAKLGKTICSLDRIG